MPEDLYAHSDRHVTNRLKNDFQGQLLILRVAQLDMATFRLLCTRTRSPLPRGVPDSGWAMECFCGQRICPKKQYVPEYTLEA